jgi:hypothetical protein
MSNTGHLKLMTFRMASIPDSGARQQGTVDRDPRRRSPA